MDRCCYWTCVSGRNNYCQARAVEKQVVRETLLILVHEADQGRPRKIERPAFSNYLVVPRPGQKRIDAHCVCERERGRENSYQQWESKKVDNCIQPAAHRKLKTPDWLSNRYFFDAQLERNNIQQTCNIMEFAIERKRSCHRISTKAVKGFDKFRSSISCSNMLKYYVLRFTETLTKAGCGVEMLEQFADCMIRPPDKKVSPAFAFEAGIKVETAPEQMFDFRYVQDRMKGSLLSTAQEGILL